MPSLLTWRERLAGWILGRPLPDCNYQGVIAFLETQGHDAAVRDLRTLQTQLTALRTAD